MELGRHLLRGAHGRRGPDGLVGLLRVLHLRRVLAGRGRQEAVAVGAGHRGPHRGEGLLREGHGVGPHVGDEAALVEPLGQAHHLLRGEPQLAAALLLQRGRHERRLGPGAVGLLLDRADDEVLAGQPVDQLADPLLREDDDRALGLAVGAEVLPGRHPDAVDPDQGGGEGRLGGEQGLQVPVGGGHEGHALPLPVHDEAGGRALHAASRQAAADLANEDWRHLPAVQPVEDAAGLGGVDQPLVQVAGVGDRIGDGRLGDLVEHHALDRHLRLEVLQQVPGDDLAFAVLVCREVELGGVLEQRPQLLDDLLAPAGELPFGLEAVVDVDAEALGGQVGDVAHGGADVVPATEMAGDRLGLGRRLDDDEGSGHRRQGLRVRGWCCQGTPGPGVPYGNARKVREHGLPTCRPPRPAPSPAPAAGRAAGARCRPR